MSEKKNMQMEIYNFLKKTTLEKGYPPSVREICEAVGLRSTSTVHGHLSRLEKKGYIRRDPTKPRAIEFTKEEVVPKEMVRIPVVGKVTAGMPILAVENIEDTFSLPLQFIHSNKELFMLKVSGTSMIEAGINDGDYAIIEKTKYSKRKIEPFISKYKIDMREYERKKRLCRGTCKKHKEEGYKKICFNSSRFGNSCFNCNWFEYRE